MKRLARFLTIILILLVIASFVSAQMPITLPFYIRLADLVDVLRTAATDNYLLVYDAATGNWGPESITGAGGVDTSGTPVDNDFAKFTDANTIEGRNYAETLDDLSGEATAEFSFNDMGIADLRWFKGTSGYNISVYSNAALTDATERNMIFYTLDATGNAWIEVFRLNPNSTTPTFDLSKSLVLSGTLASALEITATSSTAQININGTAILGSNEQAILIATPLETVPTNSIWLTLGSTTISGDLTGLRSRVTGNAASAGANVRGAYLEAKGGASKFVAQLEGVLSHADLSAGDVTVSGDIRGSTSHISSGTSLEAANLYGHMITIQTRGDETITTDDYGVRINNEAVGGNGREMDGAIQIVDTNVNATGFGTGVDMSGAVIGTADIVLQNSETIKNTADGTIEHTGFFGADVYANGSKSGAFTIDWNNGNIQTVTITGALLDITFTEPGTGGKCELWITQGDGDDTLDWTHEVNPEWPGAVAPTLSTGAADVDVISFRYMGGTTYRGIFNGDFQ